MKETIMYVITTVIVSCLFFCVSIFNTHAQSKNIEAEKQSKTYKVIRMDKLSVSPSVLKVAPGTTVIWINQSKSLAEISFINKQVTLACKSPVHFVISQDRTFVSNKIPLGAVASLCFIEKGEFDYMVTRRPRSTALEPYLSQPKALKGKVIVE